MADESTRTVPGVSRGFRFGTLAIASLYAIAILIPIYIVFVSSMKSNPEIIRTPLSLPSSLTLDNFVRAEQLGSLLRAILNSAIVVIVSLVAAVVLAFPAGYAVARVAGRLSAIVEGFFATGFLIPPLAVLVPVFLTAASLRLLNSLTFLMLFYPATVLPLSVVLLAGFIRSIPLELEDSARVDGASQSHIITRIVLPLSRPGLIVVCAINFITLWNEFLFALILTNTQSRTIQVAVGIFAGNLRSPDYGLIAAGVIMSIIPTLTAFAIAQRWIVEGLSAGATKG